MHLLARIQTNIYSLADKSYTSKILINFMRFCLTSVATVGPPRITYNELPAESIANSYILRPKFFVNSSELKNISDLIFFSLLGKN